MASFLRCPECGFTLMYYSDFIEQAKLAVYHDAIFSNKSKYSNYDPEKMCFNPNITPSLEKVFDVLPVFNRRCCRMRSVTKKHFDTMYK